MVEAVADYAIFGLDTQGRVTTWNAGAKRIKGYEASEILGEHYSVFYSERDVQEGEPQRQLDLAKSDGRFEAEGWRVRKNGAHFWANVVITALYDPQGVLRGFVKITRDRTEQKKAEERFRVVVEALPTGIVMVNRAGAILLVNALTEKLFGYGRPELLGQPIEILVPERFRTQHPEHRRGFFAAPAPRAMGGGRDLYALRKDGSEFPVEIGLNPIETVDGPVVMASVIDITERKRVEQAIRESEERFRVMVEGVTDYAILMLDTAGHVVSWNAGAERMKGYQVNEILGEHFSRFYPPEEIRRGRPEQNLKKVAAEGRSEDEGWRVRKDGSRFWANVVMTAIRDDKGHLQGFSKVTRDLTQRRQAEQKFRLLVEGAPIGMVMVSRAGTIVLVNAQIEKLFGYRRTELVGLPIETLLPVRFRDGHPEHRETFFANPSPRAMGGGRDLYALRKDGSEFPVEIGLNPIETDDGKVVMASVIDITERKRKEGPSLV